MREKRREKRRERKCQLSFSLSCLTGNLTEKGGKILSIKKKNYALESHSCVPNRLFFVAFDLVVFDAQDVWTDIFRLIHGRSD